jgi:uncharacterized protein YjiS (DUF1127 family)
MSFFERLFRRSADRRAYHNLMMMDDRMLRDMGISRSEVVSLMHGRKAGGRGVRNHE